MSHTSAAVAIAATAIGGLVAICVTAYAGVLSIVQLEAETALQMQKQDLDAKYRPTEVPVFCQVADDDDDLQTQEFDESDEESSDEEFSDQDKPPSVPPSSPQQSQD